MGKTGFRKEKGKNEEKLGFMRENGIQEGKWN